jgi:hypothetical protein
MEQKENIVLVQEIMQDFANITGLEPVSDHPQRYLWTDAFAVCNYIELFRQTKDQNYLNLAMRLVNQVHHILGRHRDDDPRTGWISSLNEEEGESHPIKGGLRIGKKLNERKLDEPYNEQLEWDQDGQYYHYLTKWMHALHCLSKVTQNSVYSKWGIELAQATHESFVYSPSFDGCKRMYWKMSIDLSYPLVPSMGQHDPLDGFITYNELIGNVPLKESDLSYEITDMVNICRSMSWNTDDPLGIGGLLSDASRTAQLIVKYERDYLNLLSTILDSALLGVEFFEEGELLNYPADYRLAFRELGLSIGLKGVETLLYWIKDNSELFSVDKSLKSRVEVITRYAPLSEIVEHFWMGSENRKSHTWTDHLEINMVMFATSLAPNGFLSI